MISPLALLGVNLARLACGIPPWIVLPATIGSVASLNFFTLLYGPSGTGKSGAVGVSRERFYVSDPSTTFAEQPAQLNLGSGEGIVAAFAHWDSKAKTTVQHCSAVEFEVDEIETLTKIAQRQGGTILAVVRSVYFGGRLGFQNRNTERAVQIPAHSYRVGLIVIGQPSKCEQLLNEEDAGTPQRFLWVPTVDPTIDRPTGEAPEVMSYHCGLQRSGDKLILGLPDVAVTQIQDAYLEAQRGQRDGLDSHALLLRAKVAALLALHEHRVIVSEEDWRLAGIITDVSARGQREVAETIAAEAAKRGEAKAKREGTLNAIRIDQQDVGIRNRAKGRILERLGKGPANVRELTLPLSKPQREHLDDILAELIDSGRVKLRGSRYVLV
jgi:hypothetical protein